MCGIFRSSSANAQSVITIEGDCKTVISYRIIAARKLDQYNRAIDLVNSCLLNFYSAYSQSQHVLCGESVPGFSKSSNLKLWNVRTKKLAFIYTNDILVGGDHPVRSLPFLRRRLDRSANCIPSPNDRQSIDLWRRRLRYGTLLYHAQRSVTCWRQR
jgi:hypothetical protein